MEATNIAAYLMHMISQDILRRN